MSEGEVFRDVFPNFTGGDSGVVLPLGHLGFHALFAAAACELHLSVVLLHFAAGGKAPTWDVARLGASEVDWDVDPLHLDVIFMRVDCTFRPLKLGNVQNCNAVPS